VSTPRTRSSGSGGRRPAPLEATSPIGERLRLGAPRGMNAVGAAPRAEARPGRGPPQ